MKISYRSYPHPVLAWFSDDLVKCAFQATVTLNQTLTTYKIIVSAVMSNKELQDMIESGTAAYALHIECSPTRYRTVQVSKDASFDFDLPVSAVEGNVDVCVLVVALAGSDKYTNANFHEDYGDREFKISKGDVLAVAEDRSFLAENKRDLLRQIPSIFTVARSTDEHAEALDYDNSGNKITIKLRSDDYDRYSSLAPATHLQPVLASMVVVPVLAEVLATISETEDPDQEYGSRRWYRVLARKLPEFGLDITAGDFGVSAVALSQKLLAEPFASGLQTVESISVED